MLVAGPLLIRSESEPRSRAILMVVARGRMAGFKLLRVVEFLNHRSRFVGPLFVPITVEVVAHVPGDVRECSEAIHGIANEAVFILATGVRVNLAIVHIKNERDNHVPIAREAEHAVELLPIGNIEAGVVESGMRWVVRMLGLPHGNQGRPVWPDHHGLAEERDGLPAGYRHTHAVYFEPVKTIDGVSNHMIVAPANKPVCSGPIRSEEHPSELQSLRHL